ncbi:MAG: uroporphyrinogen decarboxylase family protein [Candidatus Hydrogenedentota bacterium]
MNNTQWEQLLALIAGERVDPLPVGFIIDSPWLPNWAGMRILDYFSESGLWRAANDLAIDTFPEIWFLPGYWSEFGMCSEPASFGAKCTFHEDDFPFAQTLPAALGDIEKPDPATDGLAPFILQRLVHARSHIEARDHAIRFAVARGPLNIAAFLFGSSEFLMGLRMEPDQAHRRLATITGFLVDWLRLQKQTIDTIGGILLLDDIVGFLGEDDFNTFAKPYLEKAFAAFDCPVRFFHNDAYGLVCAPHLGEIGINLFNFGYEHPLAQMQALAGDRVALLGNIPPRDVLAQGTPDDVERSVRELVGSLSDTRRVILSCGGGMPPGVPTENIHAFLKAAGHAV